MKSLSQSYLNIIVLTIVVIGLVAYSFIDAQTWTAPTSAPPDGNVSTPLNVSATPQTKAGSLIVNGDLTTLSNLIAWDVKAAGGFYLQNTSPTFKFTDTNNRDWWTHVNSDSFYFLADRNDDGTWGGENPYPLVMYAGSTTTEDYVNFSNDVNAGRNVNAPGYVWTPQIWGDRIQGGDINSGWRMRSPWYCDENGNNCRDADVAQNCPAGQSVTGIAANGGLTCAKAKISCITKSGCGSAPLCPTGTTQVGNDWKTGKCSSNDDFTFRSCC